MKKLLTFLTLLTLFFGVGWAETKTATFDFTTSQTSPVTVNGVTFSWTSSNIVTGASNAANNGIMAKGSMTVTLPSGAILKQIQKTNTSNSWASTASVQVYAGNSSENQNPSIATLTGSTNIYTISSNNTGGTFFFENGTSKNAWIKNLTITYEEGGSQQTTYNVNLNQSAGGTISASPTTAAEGATVTLTATPDPGYEFTSWEVLDGDANEVTVTNNQFAMPASDVEVEATFTALQTYGITVTGGTASPTSAYAGQTVTVTPTIPDGKVIDWDNTTISPASVTLANNGSSYTFTMPSEAVTIAFSYKDAPIESTATLTNANIVAAGNGASGYNNWTISDSNDKVWNAYAIKNQHSNATSGYHYLQIKKSTTTEQYYVQVPEYGTKITKLVMTVSGSSQPMTGGGNSATLFFSSSNTTSATGTGVVYGTGASSVTIDCSSLNLNTGYITASGAVRIWDVTVYYESGEVTSNNLYIVGQVNGLDAWSATKAVKMTYDGSKYTAKFYVTGVENSALNNQGQGTHGGTFAFTTKIGSWDNVNGNRYEPELSNGDSNWWLATSGATNSGNLLNRNWNNSFLIPAGLYEIEVAGDLSTYNLKTIKDLTPAFTPASGEVNVGSSTTLATSEDFNAFIASCNAFEGTDENVSVVTPEVKLYINNTEVNTYEFATAGEVTLTGKADLVAGGTEYASKTATATFTAVQKYSATVASGITGGSVAFNAAGTQTTLNNLTEGYEVRVYVTPSTNYELTTLTYTAEGSTTQVEITTNAGDYYTFNMPAANVTINATFTYNGPVATTKTFARINSLQDLVEGERYIIVNESAQKALQFNGTSSTSSDIEIANNETTISETDAAILTLGVSYGEYTFATGNGYVANTSSTNIVLGESDTWTVTFSGNNAVIHHTVGTTDRYVRYLSNNFKAYASNNNYNNSSPVQLYKETTPAVPTTAAPTFSIPAGSFLNSDYPNGISVELACATDGATIYYSTDGTNFSEYSGAISITTNTTLYAYATNDGVQSETVSANYKFVDFLVSDVVFSPASGTYRGAQTCQMFSTAKGARIYYTMTEDGSEPADPEMNTAGTQLYTGEIPMAVGKTYKFKAIAYIGTSSSVVSSASYTIIDKYSSGNYLYSVNDLNTHDLSSANWTMVNPVQVIYMSTYQNAGTNPEYCLVRDNTGYGMIYFAKNGTYHTVANGYTVHGMGDWIQGGYYGPITNFTYKDDETGETVTADTHPELGSSNRNDYIIKNWPATAMSNSVVLPEYLTIPQILASDPTDASKDYWGHYVHLRKNTIQLVASDDPGDFTTGQDKDGKWSGSITDENGQSIMYYDKFYLQIDKGWTTTSNDFTGHPNRTFDVYGFVACYKNVYQISPFAFAWIDKPVIDKETAIYYEPQTVTLSSPDDPTATIWYKTDDMDDYAVYTEPFEVNSTTTVSWYATKQSQYNDELESKRGTITMTFDEIAKPVISPESQVKAVGESVDASIAYETGKTVANGAEIVYTTDGSDPKTSETAQVYTLGTTMNFTTTTTVRAITRVGSGDRYLYSAEADAKTYTFVKSNGIEYTLINDVTKLKENGVYVIVSQNYSEALSTTQNVNNRGAAGVLFVEGTNKAKVYGNDDVAQFTLTVLTHDEDTSPERHFLLQTNNSNVNGYLYVGHDVNNSLMTEAEEDAMGNDVAVITIDTDGRAHIHFNYAGGDNRYLQYWNRDRLFNTYKSEYDDRAVYIYGIEATPLATIEKEGVTTEGMNQYTIADELVVVWANADEGKLWCKDQGNVSIAKTEIKDGQVDYMKEVGQQHGEWDQSNWVVLQFPKPTMPENDPIKTLLNNAVGKYIEPATVTGYYIDDNNYTIQMAQAENYTLALKEGADTTKNVYCTANFLPDNLNINGQNGAAGIYHGDNRNYFFMNPKIQEVCSITFAEWTGDNTFVVPVNDAQINGSFKVDWAYNAGGPQSPAPNTAYRFVAAVQRPQGSTYLKAEQEDPIIVYPLDFTAESALPTAINTIEVGNGEIKSVKYVNVAGIVSDRPFQGVNIVVTEYTDGTRSTSKMLCK